MDPRHTCLSALRWEIKDGRLHVFLEMGGRWYCVVDEPLDVHGMTLTALRIDKIVSAIDEARYLREVERG